MKITGTLPWQGKAELEVDETLFGMMADNIGNMRTIDVTLSYPHLPGESKKKIQVTLTEVVKPGALIDIVKDLNDDLLKKATSKYTESGAMNYAMDYFCRELLYNRSWVLYGHLETRPHLKLCIIYSVPIKCGSYTFIQINPKLN